MKIVSLIILFGFTTILVAMEVNPKLLGNELEHDTLSREDAIREKRLAESNPQDYNYKDPLRVLSFAEDNDERKDENGEYTSASLEKTKLPDFFTVCLAFKFEVWSLNSNRPDIRILTMLKDNKDTPVTEWGYMTLFALSNYTKIDAKLGPAMLSAEINAVVFPQQ